MNDAAPMEMQEFIFASTSAANAMDNRKDAPVIRDHIRGDFRLHRFTVMGWLMQRGVKIPPSLFADDVHPEVGQQFPDNGR